MNKVGIVTFHESVNIGAFWQGYALREILKIFSEDVIFINLQNRQLKKAIEKNDDGKFSPFSVMFNLKRKIKFRITKKYLSSKSISDIDKLDYAVLGSDCIWSKRIRDISMPKAMFGHINANTIISYAPSTNGDMQFEEYNESYKSALKNINYISVRDEVTSDFVKFMIGKDSEIVIDPSLLYDYSSVQDINIKYSNYILIYGGMNKSDINNIEKFARRVNKKIISVGVFNRRIKTNIAVNPFEFINYLKKADYVITSMFHGTLLSVALKKQFCTITNSESRRIKLRTIVNDLSINDRIIEKSNLIEGVLSNDISYEKIDVKLDNLKKKSMMFLKKSFGKN